MSAGPEERTRLSIEREDRFARFRLISWWDQGLLQRSRVLVIGAGALGNEIIKNLALLGVGQVLIVDMDHIELSNLSRSVLYRPKDEKRPKATTAAAAAKEIYPAMASEAFMGDITTQLGLGAFRWADVVIGGLDNREARLFTNRACLKLGTPWVDGAIEALQGVVRAFRAGDEACYECTLGENDWKLLEARQACTLLTRTEMETGRVPTTPTTSAVIAGIQCQEALKILHQLDGVVYGQGYVFEGLHHQSYKVTYSRNQDCLSHDPIPDILTTGLGADDVSLKELLELGAGALKEDGFVFENEELVLEFGRDIIARLECRSCESVEDALRALGTLTEAEARCPQCQGGRAPILLNHVDFSSEWLDRSPAELGIPPWDILMVRAGEAVVGLELDGDKEQVLGRIADGENA